MASRDKWTATLEKLGATVKNSVSSKTDVLLVGDSPGNNKLEAAHAHGVPTLWFPLAEHYDLFVDRLGPAIGTVGEADIATIVLIMAKISEEHYIASRLGSERHRAAYLASRDAIRALLEGAYGPAIRTDGGADT